MLKIYLLIFFLIPFNYAICQTSINDPFKECNIEGGITIYDYQAEKWITNDIIMSQYSTLPASTFKIINTLIILDTEIIKSENEIIKWHGNPDTLKYGNRPNIYHDMSLIDAFNLSAGWVYVELSKKVGKERYRHLLDKAGYGNLDLSHDDFDFWNFGTFAVSPINQIEILKGIYEESLPFSKRSFKILKKMMIQEINPDYTLRAKTGWARDGGRDIGWWVGYIERSDNVYFFATRIFKDREYENKNFGSCRMEITHNIFRQLNILN